MFHYFPGLDIYIEEREKIYFKAFFLLLFPEGRNYKKHIQKYSHWFIIEKFYPQLYASHLDFNILPSVFDFLTRSSHSET